MQQTQSLIGLLFSHSLFFLQLLCVDFNPLSLFSTLVHQHWQFAKRSQVLKWWFQLVHGQSIHATELKARQVHFPHCHLDCAGHGQLRSVVQHEVVHLLGMAKARRVERRTTSIRYISGNGCGKTNIVKE